MSQPAPSQIVQTDHKRQSVIVVCGPTAAGKTGLAVDIAAVLGSHVINADSMQLYRGMNIGTAKITPNQMQGIPHHVFDIWPVTYTASVAEYQMQARTVIDDLATQSISALVVGGSGLYIKAVIDRLEFPGTDPAIREHWVQQQQEHGTAYVYRILAERDPVAAAAIIPGNDRRIIRALEVMDLTGRPFSATFSGPDSEANTGFYHAIQIGLDMPADKLDTLIEQRVDAMWEAGFVAEVEQLLEEGLEHGLTASRALGYQQIIAMLAGQLSPQQARERTVMATRRFVRRQRSWFRRDPRIRWFDSTDPHLSEKVMDQLA